MADFFQNGLITTVHDLRIADPEAMTQCPPDRIGEIWIGGGLVAQGYWNKPEETAQTFGAHLADTGEGPFLRTGDLGFVKDGEVVMTGRLKDLIIIEGRNHYPQDIERTVEEAHPALRPGCSAAFSVVVEGQERLVVAAEVNRGFRPAGVGGAACGGQELGARQLVGQIRAAVAEEHDITLYGVALLKPGAVLKTSSGKIQRQGCRAGYLNRSLDLWSGSQEAAGDDGNVGQPQGWSE